MISAISDSTRGSCNCKLAVPFKLTGMLSNRTVVSVMTDQTFGNGQQSWTTSARLLILVIGKTIASI